MKIDREHAVGEGNINILSWRMVLACRNVAATMVGCFECLSGCYCLGDSVNCYVVTYCTQGRVEDIPALWAK